MGKLEMKAVALSLGLFGVVTFVLCVGWGLLLPRFHATPLLEMTRRPVSTSTKSGARCRCSPA